jgi:hypothetical protein
MKRGMAKFKKSLVALSMVFAVSTFASSSYALTSVEQAYIDHSLHPSIFPAKVIFHQNGTTKELDSSNIVLNYNNRTYIPLRAFSESMGAQVNYYDYTQNNGRNAVDIILNYDVTKIYDYPRTQDTQRSIKQDQLVQDAPIGISSADVTFNVNGKIQTLESNGDNMLNYKDRIYIPIRSFSETVGAQVDYSDTNGPTVTVTLDGK